MMNENWKFVVSEETVFGKVDYYETGCKKNYAAWHVVTDTFMGWLPKGQVKK